MTRSRVGVLLPSLGAGILLALSLPPWGWWPLGFVGAGLLYWRLAGLPTGRRFLAGWVAGLGCFGIGLFFAHAFNWYGAVVLIVVEAVSMGVAAALVPPGRWRGPAAVGAFTLLEAVRMTWPFGGLPIGGVFLGQAGGPWLGVARLGGPLALTALVWTGGVALGSAAMVARAWSEPASRRGTLPGAAARTGLVALVLVLGLWPLADVAPDGGGGARHLSVALVQGGGRRGYSKEEVAPASVFTAQLAATAELRGRPGPVPQLVVWPEDVISLSGPLTGSSAATRMSTLARGLRATVLAGVTTQVSSTAFRNEVVAWGPTGRIVAVFEKVHRVPFGEYVPYRGFFSHLANLSGVALDAVPGHGSGLVDTPAAPLAVLVSFEVFYAGRGRSGVDAGGQLIVVPTNTSSYSTSQIPSQEVAADRVQAVAQGRDVVQASPTGYSSVVDHRGAVLRRSVLGRRQVVVASVTLRTGGTLYRSIGDLPLVIASIVLVVASWLGVFGQRRRRRQS